MKIKLEELKAALAEIGARGKGESVFVEIIDNRFHVSSEDRDNNKIEAIIYKEGALGAHFRMTHRLMFMKDKKRL